MLDPKKHVNDTMYPVSVYVSGQDKEKSNISQQMEVIEDTSLEMKKKTREQNQPSKSSTLVFQVENNKVILKDKENISEKSTQNINLFPMSEAESISRERGSRGFWKECSKEISQRLWLPKETDSQDLDTHYLSGFSNSTVHSSFVIKKKMKENRRMNCQRTSWLSSRCLPPATMEEEITGKNEIQYCRKVRFYPHKEFKILSEKCFGSTRYLWNKALDKIKEGKITKYSHISLRKAILVSDKELTKEENKHEEWLKEIPYDTRQLILKQLASNFSTNFTLLRKKIIKKFEMKYKTKRNQNQIFFIDRRAIKPSQFKIFTRRTKNKFRLRKKMKKWWEKNILEIDQDIIVKREKNRYYLCIPRKKEKEEVSQPHNCVALDPGVRTFQTFYSEENIAGKIGDNICERLMDIGHKEDNLRSVVVSSKRTRYNIKNRRFLLRTKIKNVVNDLHWKTANYLCKIFKHIFLPTFNVSNMVTRLPTRARKIGSKTVRNMLFLSHYKFKERLRYMGKVKGCTIHDCNEAYTTRTCGMCGNQEDMGGKKVFRCSVCPFELDRDYNGARNIYIKQIGFMSGG